ncbi:MAG: hypothetical protein JETT_1371 [Candidatus Jettenia ecosi]|uniref:Uncharacterized protein n=1 Tax=Candidatus Jettenia ecosi TaxID=2494326 RepID=A0A533QCY3_9BACT|nr:MAG: hypothetical protein JETT_1371 [Candidatus Jettenia ecosi]
MERTNISGYEHMRTLTMTGNHKNAYGFNTVLLATSKL